MADTIICTKCGQEKPRTKPGRKRCKDCDQAYNRQQYEKRAAEFDPTALRQCSKCGETKPRYNAHSPWCSACYLARARVGSRAWRAKNPDKVRALFEAWEQRNPEKNKRSKDAYRDRNRETLRRKNREYKAANPEQRANDKTRRRLMESNIIPIPRGWKALQMERQGGKCAGCFKRFGPRRKAQIDHIIPLALGGDNDITNLQLLCDSCNPSKGAKPEHVWRRELGQLL